MQSRNFNFWISWLFLSCCNFALFKDRSIFRHADERMLTARTGCHKISFSQDILSFTTNNNNNKTMMIVRYTLAAVLLVSYVSAFTPSVVQQRASASTTTTTKTTLFEASADFADSAQTISEAAASLRGKTIVVKYGGNAMTSPELKAGFCKDVAALQNLGLRIVVVHGGGPQISAMLETVGIEATWEGGMRVSTKEVVDVAEMVLCGSVNKEIASTICSAGGRALGLSGRDDSLLQCVKKINKDGYDLGNVGEVEAVNTKLLNELLDMGICPVVSPIGTGMGDEKDVAYNCNADVAAGRIAGELRAARVLFLTDIAGVLDKNMELLPTLSCDDVDGLISDETITGGMIPKVTYATGAVKLGVGGAFITDGRVPHALLKEVLAGGAAGTGSGAGGTFVSL